MAKYVDRTGETRMMNCGMMATVTAYRGNRDADILFENGMTVPHRHYKDFLNGNISNPADKSCKQYVADEYAKIRIGEEAVAKCGLRMKITAYRNKNDMDIEFEDKTIVTNKRYSNFIEGNVSHPGLGAKAFRAFHGFDCKRNPTFRTETAVYYNAINLQTNERCTMTPQEMIQWEKQYQIHQSSTEVEEQENCSVQLLESDGR